MTVDKLDYELDDELNYNWELLLPLTAVDDSRPSSTSDNNRVSIYTSRTPDYTFDLKTMYISWQFKNEHIPEATLFSEFDMFDPAFFGLNSSASSLSSSMEDANIKIDAQNHLGNQMSNSLKGALVSFESISPRISVVALNSLNLNELQWASCEAPETTPRGDDVALPRPSNLSLLPQTTAVIGSSKTGQHVFQGPKPTRYLQTLVLD
jgi:hypothetical protein